MADLRRLAELGMATELAKEVAAQIDAAAPDPTPSPVPVAYSVDPEDLAAALVNAGLMEPDA